MPTLQRWSVIGLVVLGALAPAGNAPALIVKLPYGAVPPPAVNFWL